MALASSSDAAVRAAGPADVDALLPLVRALFRDESIVWNEPRTRSALVRLLADADLGAVMLCEHAGAVVGYAIVTWGFDLEFGGRDAFLTDVFVEPTARNRGLGARLLAQVFETARAAGAGAVHLQVRIENEGARRLYERIGFEASPRVTLSRPL